MAEVDWFELIPLVLLKNWELFIVDIVVLNNAPLVLLKNNELFIVACVSSKYIPFWLLKNLELYNETNAELFTERSQRLVS